MTWWAYTWIAGSIIGIIYTGILSTKDKSEYEREHTISAGIFISLTLGVFIVIGLAISAPFYALVKLGQLIVRSPIPTKKDSNKESKFKLKNKEIKYKRRIAQLEKQLDEQKIKLANLGGYRQ